MGWKDQDRRNFGNIIRRGTEGTIKGKEWANLPQNVKRAILEGKERVYERGGRKRRENVVSKNKVEEKRVKAVESSESMEQETLTVCVRKEVRVVNQREMGADASRSDRAKL